MSQALPPFKHVLVIADRRWAEAGPALLQPYLAQHPERVADLWRYVPEVKDGLQVAWTERAGRIVLERMTVKGHDDPTLEMALWHALFPGLRRPLVAWWLNDVMERGEDRPSDPGRRSTDPAAFEEETLLRQGTLLSRVNGNRAHTRWHDRDLQDWPFGIRLLLFPLVVVLFPVAVVSIVLQARRAGNLIPLWAIVPFLLVMPIFLGIWLGPSSLYLRIGALIQGWVAPIHHHAAVKNLLAEALDREPPKKKKRV